MAHVASILEVNVVVGPYSRFIFSNIFYLRYIFLHQPILTCLTGTGSPGSPGSHDFFFPSMITDPRNETSCIEKIFYETMPAEKVKIVERLGLKFIPDGDGKETFV